MAEMNRLFSGSMPELYDRFLVPLQFEPFAQDLAERLGTVTSGQLLELAAGTGVVTRALARTLPGSVDITATDLNPAMLEQAKTYAELERVVWQEADAMALPFPDEAFDYLVCQFGVMFFPDKPAAFRQVRRVLRRAGDFCSTYGVTKQARPGYWRNKWSGKSSRAILPAWSLRNTTISRRSRPTSPRQGLFP